MKKNKSISRSTAKKPTQPAQPIRYRPYFSRHIPVSLHDKLDILSVRLHKDKEKVVNQCLEIGVSFLLGE